MFPLLQFHLLVRVLFLSLNLYWNQQRYHLLTSQILEWPSAEQSSLLQQPKPAIGDAMPKQLATKKIGLSNSPTSDMTVQPSTRVRHPKKIYKPKTRKYVVKDNWLRRIVLDRSHVVEWLYKPFFMNCWDLFVDLYMEVATFIWIFLDISSVCIWTSTFIHMNIIVSLHEQCCVSISLFS